MLEQIPVLDPAGCREMCERIDQLRAHWIRRDAGMSNRRKTKRRHRAGGTPESSDTHGLTRIDQITPFLEISGTAIDNIKTIHRRDDLERCRGAILDFDHVAVPFAPFQIVIRALTPEGKCAPARGRHPNTKKAVGEDRTLSDPLCITFGEPFDAGTIVVTDAGENSRTVGSAKPGADDR